MASGHVNRANRPNTWLHRPSLRREVFPCQLGAVHTWHIAAPAVATACPQLAEADIRVLNEELGFDPRADMQPRAGQLRPIGSRCYNSRSAP